MPLIFGVKIKLESHTGQNILGFQFHCCTVDKFDFSGYLKISTGDIIHQQLRFITHLSNTHMHKNTK